MKISFTKMSGAGNDFVVIDNRSMEINNPEKAAKILCHRKYGIGADGLLLLETSSMADFTMKYYNADGSNAGMCGNGGRCLAKYAFDYGIVRRENFSFDGFGYIYQVQRIQADLYELTMKNPSGLREKLSIHTKSHGIIQTNYLNTGTDHAVIFLNDNSHLGELPALDVVGLGRELRYHEIFQPLGTNVNFVQLNKSNNIEIRTYERGVEDETLACGTGSVASALLSSLKYSMGSPINVKVLSGETLEINFKNAGGLLNDVKLKGSARTVFNGEIEI